MSKKHVVFAILLRPRTTVENLKGMVADVVSPSNNHATSLTRRNSATEATPAKHAARAGNVAPPHINPPRNEPLQDQKQYK